MVRGGFSGKIIFFTLGISKTECYQGQESFGFYLEIFTKAISRKTISMGMEIYTLLMERSTVGSSEMGIQMEKDVD